MTIPYVSVGLKVSVLSKFDTLLAAYELVKKQGHVTRSDFLDYVLEEFEQTLY